MGSFQTSNEYALRVAQFERRPFSFVHTRVQMNWNRLVYVWDRRTGMPFGVQTQQTFGRGVKL